ncbi:TRAP transporter substrate-binding protein [Vogesella oryzae]|uniref:TRAP transporter substrate-binding protein n=1 Tax=Vogesella oryzae TaxID=1735285 RepID=UPI001582F66E|nr:TRAP transporter substrate-binding protein [Vogesella oryzae]
MKTTIKPVLFSLIAAGVLLSPLAGAADIKPRIIRFGYGLAEDSNQGRAVKMFAQEVAKLSGGKLKVKGFGSASLGNDIQMQNALIGGAQEMMVGSTATLVGVDKDFGVYDLPFLFSNEREADTVLDGTFGSKLLGRLPAKGLVGLTYWENGFRNVTNTKHPINRFEDFQGIKLRVMQNPVYIDMFNSFGANAVPMAFSELFTALETKTVDGQENPVNTIQSSKFYEVQKYLSVTKHVYSPWVVTVSKKWWDGLSRDEQKVLQDAANSSRAFERKDSRAEAMRSVKFLAQQGMQINYVSDAELKRMRDKAKPAFDKFAAAGGATVLADLQSALSKSGQ